MEVGGAIRACGVGSFGVFHGFSCQVWGEELGVFTWGKCMLSVQVVSVLACVKVS